MFFNTLLLMVGILFSHQILSCQKEPDYNMEVILSIELDQFLISDELIGYQNSKGDILYPLVDLMTALEIDLTTKNGKVMGSIFNEKNTIEIAPKLGKATFQETEILDKSYQQLTQDEELACYLETIYVSESILKVLLPAEFEYDSSLLRTLITPSRLFPVQIEQKKEALLKRQGWIGGYQDKSMTQQYNDAAFSWNIGTLSTQINSNFETSSVSLETGGRFLYHDIGLFASTNVNGNKARLNLVGSRRIFDPDYQPYLSYYEFGDTSITSTKGVSNNHVGIGASFTNRPFNFLSERERDFSGTVAANWFVEMYINDMLMGFAEPDQNNRFSFEGIRLFPGKNLVKYVFYGPQGQIETSETEYFWDDLSYNKSKFFYKLDFVRAGSGLLKTALGDEKEGEIKMNETEKYSLFHSKLSYGITDSLSFKFDTWHKLYDENKDGRDSAPTLMRPGIKARYSNFLQLEYYLPFYLNNSDHFANQIKFTLYPFKRLSLWADADFYHNGYKNLENTESLTYRYKVGARYFLSSIRTRVSADVESTESAKKDNHSVNTSLSLNTTLGNYSSALFFERRRDSIDTLYKGRASLSYANDYLTQQISVSGISDNQYGGVNKLSYSNRLPFFGNWLNVFRSQYSFRDNSYKLSNSIVYTNNHYSLGIQASYKSTTGLSAGLSFNTSLIRDDKNEFGLINRASATTSLASIGVKIIKADGTESYIKKGAIKINGRTINLNTSNSSLANDNGTIISDIEPYKWITVELDESALEDTSWMVKTKPVDVMIEPGGMERIVFTVVETGEIDGMVLSGKELKAKKGVKVWLLSKQGKVIKETVSAFDGFYLFDKVEPGEYIVKIDSAYLERKEMNVKQKNIKLEGENMFALNNDFILLPGLMDYSPDYSTTQVAELVTKQAEPSDAEKIAKNDWLSEQNPDNFTFQLLAISINRKTVLDELISKHPALQNDLRYFTSTKNGEQKLVLIYGSFASSSEAELASKSLPPIFSRFWLRNLSSLQNEVSTISDFTLASSSRKKIEKVVEHSWLAKQNPDDFTLQLLSVSKDKKAVLEKLILKYPKHQNDLHYFIRTKNSKENLVLVYGNFATLSAAKQAKKGLPQEFSMPWLRNFKGLQVESSMLLTSAQSLSSFLDE